jgi:hypothetical protein
MPHWYEVFDNDRVQLLTRKQATRLVRYLVAAFVVTGGIIAVGLNYKPIFLLIIVSVLVAWFVAFWWITSRLRLLRRVVWCVKISDRKVEAYDYTRKKITLDWTEVQRIEITKEGLIMTGPDYCAFEIPQLFTDFAALSHRIIFCAELYDVPIYVDGQSWQSIDVYELYPFLAEGTSSE